MSDEASSGCEERRVVAQGLLRCKGTLHSKLPRMMHSSALYGALIAIRRGDGYTVYSIQIGSHVDVEVTSDMTITPTLKQHSSMHCGADGGIIQLHCNSKHLSINMTHDDASYKVWYRALREALAETIFRDAFQYRTSEGTLSSLHIEAAVQKCVALVPPANCHVLRAKRVIETSAAIHKFTKRIKVKPHFVSREEAEMFLSETKCDPLFSDDGDVVFIQSLIPRLFTKHDIKVNSRAHDSHTIAAEAHKILNTGIHEVPPSLLQSIECQDVSLCSVISSGDTPDTNNLSKVRSDKKRSAPSPSRLTVDKVVSVSTDEAGSMDKENKQMNTTTKIEESSQNSGIVNVPAPRQCADLVSSSPLPKRSRSLLLGSPARKALSRTVVPACKLTSPLVSQRHCPSHSNSDVLVIVSKTGDSPGSISITRRLGSSSSIQSCFSPNVNDPSENSILEESVLVDENERIEVPSGLQIRSLKLFCALLWVPLLIAGLLRGDEVLSRASWPIKYSTSSTILMPDTHLTVVFNQSRHSKFTEFTGENSAKGFMGSVTDENTRKNTDPKKSSIILPEVLVHASLHFDRSNEIMYAVAAERKRRREEFLEAVLYGAVE